MSERIESGMVQLGLALTLFLATSGRAQETAARATSSSSSSQETATSSKPKQKPSLLDATRVSTEEAAKTVAQKKAAKATEAKAVESSADESVTEFHPTRADSAQTSGAVATTSEKSKKPELKRVHGTVEGSTAAGTSRGGGASVGTASKSGKTAVYVETDHSRRDTPH